MKKLVVLSTLLASTTLCAEALQTFDQIQSAVTQGETIHIAIDFTQCSPNKALAPMAIGIFTPNALLVTNNYISTSLTHFTLNNPTAAGKPVFEFVTYTMTEDNNLKLTAQVLDAPSYKPLADKASFSCKIGAGAKVYS